MNILFLIIIVFIVSYFLLSWFANSSSKKIIDFFRNSIIFTSIIVALVAVLIGRYVFSIPLILGILPLIKTKAGMTLIQLFRLWGLIRVLKNNNRFNFTDNNNYSKNQSMSEVEAYEILNLNPKKNYTKSQILQSYKNIMKKIHPDKNPELNSLAVIVNQAKDTLTKNST
jgi:magnesium-transporting ATPase (P-type)